MEVSVKKEKKMITTRYLHPTEEMKRISPQELAENLDEILDTVTKENRLFINFGV